MSATLTLMNAVLPRDRRARKRYFRKILRFAAPRDGMPGMNVMLHCSGVIKGWFQPDDWWCVADQMRRRNRGEICMVGAWQPRKFPSARSLLPNTQIIGPKAPV